MVAKRLQSAARRHLEAWRIRMAADHLESLYGHLATLSACQERANSGLVAFEKVAFASFKRPGGGLLQLGKTVLFKCLSAILHGMEVTLRVGQGMKHFLRV